MTVPAGERGTTTVAPRAVRRIAERAAAEALPDGGSVLRGSAAVRGASARIAVGVRLPYPVRADEAARRVRERAATRTATLTGLSVPRAEVRVDALSPGAPTAALDAVEAANSPGDGKGGSGPRIRARRRVPAAVLAAVGAVACGLVLVDVVAVRFGEAPAGWRTAVLDWASGHGPADTAVRLGGAVAALVGAWLLGCALLPGLRRRLRMAAPAPDVRAALDRTAAARVLRERALGVPGVVHARVSVRRRRARVLAGVGYGDPDEVRAEAVRVLGASLPELGLARTPVLRVRVRVRREAGGYGRAPQELTGVRSPGAGMSGVPEESGARDEPRDGGARELHGEGAVSRPRDGGGA
ncbi:DEAD/DEAH box helicase [Kitasatospora albolonga]|uniref:DEAD/DEAH box helicase n=1 Tax=Kitasatospora albolonga TaxID=68173 RepID=A0ABC8C3I6_9ACTN|nr:DEAD/DEAH box helicase [Kitasatospora albolonga]